MAPIWNNLLKKGLQEEMITLWVSNSKSSQAKVTSEKSLSSLSSVKDTLIFSWKSFHSDGASLQLNSSLQYESVGKWINRRLVCLFVQIYSHKHNAV